MHGLVRKARGVLGLALSWGAAWFAIGYAVGVVVGLVDPDSMDPGETPLLVGTVIGTVGLLSGGCFGLLLALAEQRKRLTDLSLGRAALWGALGAAAPLVLSGMPDGMVPITAPLGAAFAAATVAIARRVARHDARELVIPARAGIRTGAWPPLPRG